MGVNSLYKKDSPIILGNNMEGAILFQILFQNLNGPMIKQAIPDILTHVLSRIKQTPMSPTFQRSLLAVFHSSLLCDATLTLSFLV
jgi:hypothetical protein